MTKLVLNDEEKRLALSEIRKLVNTGMSDIESHKSVFELWQDSGISLEEWSKQIHTWPHTGEKTPTPVSFFENKNGNGTQRNFVFKELAESIVLNCGRLPTDQVLNSIAVFFGFSRGIASTTRLGLMECGKWDVQLVDGYWIFTDKIDPILKAAQDDLIAKQSAFQAAMSHYEEIMRQRK
jgi:hypothetical protein